MRAYRDQNRMLESAPECAKTAAPAPPGAARSRRHTFPVRSDADPYTTPAGSSPDTSTHPIREISHPTPPDSWSEKSCAALPRGPANSPDRFDAGENPWEHLFSG